MASNGTFVRMASNATYLYRCRPLYPQRRSIRFAFGSLYGERELDKTIHRLLLAPRAASSRLKGANVLSLTAVNSVSSSSVLTASDRSKVDTTVYKMAPTLYVDVLSPPCRTVLWTAKLIGVELDVKHISLGKKEHLTAEFLKINPQHSLPTLIDGPLKLAESRTICRYLINKYAPNHALYPENPGARAVVDRLLDFDLGSLYGALAGYFYPVYFMGKEFNEERGDKLKESLEFLLVFLGNDKFLGGENLCLGDITVASSLSTLEVMGYDLSPFPKVKAYYNALTTAPHFHEVHAEGIAAFKGIIDHIKSSKK